MKTTRMNRLLSILLIASMLGGVALGMSWENGVEAHSDKHAYIEPALLAQTGELQVIVTAAKLEQAKAAVAQVGGKVTAELGIIDAVAAAIPSEKLALLGQATGVVSVVLDKPIKTSDLPPTQPDPNGWVTDFRFPVPWDGTQDVQLTNTWSVRKLVYPVNVDLGLSSFNTGYGNGVTVAVVDTGVYFDRNVKTELGKFISRQFVGQADFVDSTCTLFSGIQGAGYCFESKDSSDDPHGHGSHIAGTIWNNITDQYTGAPAGVAPSAKILSVRVLGGNGGGTYSSVIQGVQYVVANKATYNIRVMNLSLSAPATTPYFIDPLDRAVEKAWQAGIVVLAAAGNTGPNAETISVPGNDPYVITVGAVDGRRTPGYWADDFVPAWSASGPTLDGFLKPDILAPGAQIVSFMYKDPNDITKSAYLVQHHPDYSQPGSLFRMSGTSMATAVTSGAVAALLSVKPGLTPDQVKYRLMATARQLRAADGGLGANLLQQGAGRIYLPDLLNATIPDGYANVGMNINNDLAAGWGALDALGLPVLDISQLRQHYTGPAFKVFSTDGQYVMYYAEGDTARHVLGVTDATGKWILETSLPASTTWAFNSILLPNGIRLTRLQSGEISLFTDKLIGVNGKLVWSGGVLIWRNGSLYDLKNNLIYDGKTRLFDSTGRMIWDGGRMIWDGGRMIWDGANFVWDVQTQLFNANGNLIWSGGKLTWIGNSLSDSTGRMIWDGSRLFDSTGRMIWDGGRMIWDGGRMIWDGGRMIWDGGRMIWDGGLLVGIDGSAYSPISYTSFSVQANLTWQSGRMIWDGGRMIWDGGRMIWDGSATTWDSGRMIWDGGRMIWDGARMIWDGGRMIWDGGRMIWDGAFATFASTITQQVDIANTSASSTMWVEWK